MIAEDNIKIKLSKSDDNVDVVIISADDATRKLCRQSLEAHGRQISTFVDSDQALTFVQTDKPYVIVIDMGIKGESDLKIINQFKEIDATMSIIAVLENVTIDMAVNSMKAGAYNVLKKPVSDVRLVSIVEQGIEETQKHREMSDANNVADNSSLQTGLEKDSAEEDKLLFDGLKILEQGYARNVTKEEIFEKIEEIKSLAASQALGDSIDLMNSKEIAKIVKNLKLVNEKIKFYDYQKNALIQIMIDLQKVLRWLPRYVLNWLSYKLDVPQSRIYSILNFYESLNKEPVGAFTVQVCTGTACHVRGATELLIRVSSVLGVEPEETDKDQTFTLKAVHCLGCCALGPVMEIDGSYYSNPSTSKLKKIFKSYADKKETL